MADASRLAAGSAWQTATKSVVDLPTLVTEHHAVVYRYACRLCGCRAEAEDLTQQAFLIAHQKLSQLREADRARAWLLAIVRSCFLKSIRKPRPTPAADMEMAVDDAAESSAAVDEIDGEELTAALAELPDEFRLVLLMFYFEEFSYQEIAVQLDIPVGTVMSRLSRAKGHLRMRLAPPDSGDTHIAPPPRSHETFGIQTIEPIGRLDMNKDVSNHDPRDGGQASIGGLAGLQPFDQALTRALHDIPVPDDLGEQILAKIRAEATPAVTKSNTPTASPARHHLRRMTRRRVIAAGSVALATLLAISVWCFRWPARLVPREELSADVTNWLALSPKNWRPMAALPKGVEVDSGVAAQGRQWQSFRHTNSAGWSANVIAIDLAPAAAPRATLFIVRSNACFAVPAIPTTTACLGLSSGYVATAWQRPSNVLYVLVVETGSGQRLEDFLRKTPQA